MTAPTIQPSVKQIRETFREAFYELGGANWLVDFANRNDGNARVFVSALTKLMPQELIDGDGSPLQVTVTKIIRELPNGTQIDVAHQSRVIEGEFSLPSTDDNA